MKFIPFKSQVQYEIALKKLLIFKIMKTKKNTSNKSKYQLRIVRNVDQRRYETR